MAAMTGSAAAPPVEGPVYKGWMMKEGHDLRATFGMGDWKERFFVLYYTEEWKEYHLLYYKEEANFEVCPEHFFLYNPHHKTIYVHTARFFPRVAPPPPLYAYACAFRLLCLFARAWCSS